MHIGFPREMILGDVLHRCLVEQGADTKFNLFLDSLDPLRDRERDGKSWYPFLPDSFREHVGKPVADIPAPDGSDRSYAEHFFTPVRGYLKSLGIHCEIVESHQVYRGGMMTGGITQVLEKLPQVKSIMQAVTGLERPEGWTGLNVICHACGRIDQSSVTDWDIPSHTVSYKCDCGHSGEADYSRGEVKLTWRLDWPARWAVLGVTAEPFGKDHATAGGSYDSGVRLAREIFGVQPPEPIIYEWLYDKEGRPLSSSSGVVIEPAELLRSAAPEIFRFFIVSTRPNKGIRFDPREDILDLYRQYEALAEGYWSGEEKGGTLRPADRRNYELSQVEERVEPETFHVSFRNLVSLLQISGGDRDRLRGALERTGNEDALQHWEKLEQKIEYAENWIELYAPPEAKMEIREELPEEARSFPDPVRRFLHLLADYLESGPHDAEDVHNRIYHLAREEAGIEPKQAFQAVYRVFLGQDRGPRAGWFLCSLDPGFAVRRLREVG